MTPADTAGPGGGALPASGHAERWMQVHELLCRFQSAFDEHDWDALAACLAPRVYTDYSSFRGTAPATVDRDEYVGLRRAALSTLRMQHGFSNLRVEPLAAVDGLERARARCHYAIHRFGDRGPDGTAPFFHSFGRYVFELERPAGAGWRIAGITQVLLENVGDPAIHAGAR